MSASNAASNAMPRNDDRLEGAVLSAARIGLFVAVGAGVWLFAALMVRYLGPISFDQGLAHVALYVFCAPLAFVSTWMIAKVTGTPLNAMVGPMVIMTTTAVFLDGTALVWAPGLYGGADVAAHGGAAILWGLGWFFVAAIAFAGGRVRA